MLTLRVLKLTDRFLCRCQLRSLERFTWPRVMRYS
jgi:hypothetical protein